MTFGSNVLQFYKSLQAPKLPKGVLAMNPYTNAETMALVKQFTDKFYNDTSKRILVLGINPGRIGGGSTGVNFTDPVALEQFCGITNNLPKKRELSSEFVYNFIKHFCGLKRFYKHFFLSAICPLGFTKDGLNYNYYDDKNLLKATEPFIVSTLRQQITLGASVKSVILFGTGKNLKTFTELNNTYHFFEYIYALEHPRFIMQYKRKQLPQYLKKYSEIFSRALLNK